MLGDLPAISQISDYLVMCSSREKKSITRFVKAARTESPQLLQGILLLSVCPVTRDLASSKVSKLRKKLGLLPHLPSFTCGHGIWCVDLNRTPRRRQRCRQPSSEQAWGTSHLHVGNQLMGQGGRGELRGLNYCLPLTGREDVEEKSYC